MKKLILAATLGASALAGTAIATQTAAPAPPPPGAHQIKHGRTVPPATRDEATQRADQRFARMDTNGDGTITTAEREAKKQARAEHREARKAMRKQGGERRIARMDTDGDGNVSREEHRAHALQRFQRQDTNADGRIDDAERSAMRARMQARMQQRHASPPPAPAQ